MTEDFVKNLVKIKSECYDFYKPNYKMKNGKWLIAYSIVEAMRQYQPKYKYSRLLSDIAMVLDTEYSDKNFLPMCQKQYFSRHEGYYNALVSIELTWQVLSLYNYKDNRKIHIINHCKIFNYEDCIEKYNKYQLSKGYNAVFEKIEKLEIKPYVGGVKTHEDVLIEHAQKLAENATDAERNMSRILDALNVKYRFQYPCNNGRDIIMDFYIPDRRVNIEIDGAYHFDEKMLLSDRLRDQNCARLGILVLRYGNNIVKYPTQVFVEDLCKILQCKPTDKAIEMCISEEMSAKMIYNEYQH